MIYQASRIKRTRAHKAEIESRYTALVEIGYENYACTVHECFYKAAVALWWKQLSRPNSPYQHALVAFLGATLTAHLLQTQVLYNRSSRAVFVMNLMRL